MARSAVSRDALKSPRAGSGEVPDQGRNLALALLLGALSILTTLSLSTAADPAVGRTPVFGLPPNAAGEFGVVWAGFWIRLLGRGVAWGLLPLGTFWCLRLMAGLLRGRLARTTIPYLLLLASTAVTGHAVFPDGDPYRWGGIGAGGVGLLRVFGPAGAPVVAVTVWLLLLGLNVRLALAQSVRSAVSRGLLLGASRAVDVAADGLRALSEAAGRAGLRLWERWTARRERGARVARETGSRGLPRRRGERPLVLGDSEAGRFGIAKDDPEAEPRIVVPERRAPKDDGGQTPSKTTEPALPFTLRGALQGPFPLPPQELLTDPPAEESRAVDKGEILEKSRLLERVLAEFGIVGAVGEVHPGPVITRYDVAPGSGVRIAQITSRADDLALALRASRVRLAPIPGKAAVGIEVPNDRPARIYLKEVVSTDAFRNSNEPLLVAMGKDIAGHPFYASLDKMPHLLVAGTTGSGKSMFLHTIILSLLLRRTPQDVRFLLIDPKRLEFSPFEGIPHLLAPVVTEAKDASRTLQWLLREMDRRYLVFARLGLRNIQNYWSLPRSEDPDEAREPLPMLVVIVDELADLMLTGTNDIETSITRLAQMARAVGIHLVLATQRPSVDVLTGLIKANFPARIAFQVATRIDSRTVLDANGAESLLGHGDMLFIPPGKAQAHRLHAPLIPDRDRERVIEHLKRVAEAHPDPSRLILDDDVLDQDPLNDADDDDLLEEAMRIVVQHQQGSTSLLQRKLRVGYTRAARLIDMLERRGVVGPFEGSKARAVLVDRGGLEERLARDA